MKKEEIIKVLSYLEDWIHGDCTTPEQVAEEMISSSQDETSKVITNEKAKEVCHVCGFGSKSFDVFYQSWNCLKCGNPWEAG